MIRIGDNSYTLRLANKSTAANCSNSSYSETACGFVIEFEDVVGTNYMRTSNTNAGGYPATEVYRYLKEDFYNSLPDDLKNVITTTRVISGHGSSDSSNFTTNDKLYLLSRKEVDGSNGSDSAANSTTQLDFYVNSGTHTMLDPDNPLFDDYFTYIIGIRKQEQWWLRNTGNYHNSNSFDFIEVATFDSSINNWGSSSSFGVSPAFRIE